MSGILAMVLIVNPLMLLPLSGAILLFYGAVKLYSKPAQDMKRLEGICMYDLYIQYTRANS